MASWSPGRSCGVSIQLLRVGQAGRQAAPDGIRKGPRIFVVSSMPHGGGEKLGRMEEPGCAARSESPSTRTDKKLGDPVSRMPALSVKIKGQAGRPLDVEFCERRIYRGSTGWIDTDWSLPVHRNRNVVLLRIFVTSAGRNRRGKNHLEWRRWTRCRYRRRRSSARTGRRFRFRKVVVLPPQERGEPSGSGLLELPVRCGGLRGTPQRPGCQ